MRFSVIVPIYRVESYLRQCVDSVLAQTYGDFELILVDDGSPDGCPAICDEYAVKDARVKVIHKSNGGIVSARQAGLQAAQGEYIAPVDGDDWIAPDFLEQAIKILDTYDVDMVSFGYTEVEENGRQTIRQEPVPEGFYDRASIERGIWPRVLLSKDGKHIVSALWAKVYRKELIFNSQMMVDCRISYAEDKACQVLNYRDAKSVYISYKRVYFYRILQASMSHGLQTKWVESLCYFVQFIEKVKGMTCLETQLHQFILNISIWMTQEAFPLKKQKEVKELLRTYLTKPEICRHLNAIAQETTLKNKITFFLLRHGWLECAAALWRMCEKLKTIGVKRLLIRLHFYQGEVI